MTTEAPISPWYKQPWFWFLLIFPGASIIWCTIAITVALNTENAMVTDDWSKQGRGINMSIARDQKAEDMGMEARLAFNDQNITLNLETLKGPADIPYLVLKLFHPTLSDKDRVIQFRQIAPGRYAGQLHEEIDGRWYYDLQGPGNEWRLKGEAWLPAENGITVKAGGSAQG